MNLRDRLLNPSIPVTLFEVVPPPAGKPEALEQSVNELRQVRHLVDAINLPEIRDEDRGAKRTSKFVQRVDPRRLAKRILRDLEMESVVNHVVVHDVDAERWFRETYEQYGVRDVILVGGESNKVRYPGPNPVEAVELIRPLGLPVSLGGITIPSRDSEPDRIRRKNGQGIDYFTSQVLFDSNDIVWLMQRLNGLEARIFLSFVPVSHRRDLEFLRWLGADIPADLDRFLLGSEINTSAPTETCLERSLNLAQRILMDVFDNLPPDPPPIGLNIEHINRRNFAPALEMLDRLGTLYTNLLAARARTSLA